MAILVCDSELYRDFFLLMFRNVETGNTKYFELYEGHPLDIDVIRPILAKNTIVTFNGINYDIPIITYALTGADNTQLKALSDYIIIGGYKYWHCEQAFKFKISQKLDHIDLIEVAPGKGSLKAYGGRLHSKTIQDLPIDPSDSISPVQRQELIEYCSNDLQTTIDLYNALKPQIALREEMSKTYGMDLRSKSDAQIAEHVIKSEVEKLKGCKVEKPRGEIKPFKYKKPDFIEFKTLQLKELLNLILNAVFVVTDSGKVVIPKDILEKKIALDRSSYTIGIGGIHSNESSTNYLTDENSITIDKDVVSYYPNIILQQRLFPKEMGKDFLNIYDGIVKNRIAAKLSGEKVKSESLKITINGSFGKFGSKYSSLYSPDLLIQTTLTGQLALLMLIEELEISSASVVSANTDGIVIHCHKDKQKTIDDIISWWELITGFETEETEYKALYSRDVNNYIALKKNGGVKLKGAYAPPGLQKNPTNEICSEAVVKFLDKEIPIEDTVMTCKDIRKFITIRQVKGGAVKNGVYLGRVCRWYYSIAAARYIEYKVNGYKVPRSEGAMPCMTLPNDFPEDLDYNWYIEESYKILEEIGCGKAKSRNTLGFLLRNEAACA